MRINTVLICCLLLSGCASVGESDRTLQTRIAWSQKCPALIDEKEVGDNRSLVLGGLIAVVAPQLITGAIDAAAASLKAAGESKSIVSVGNVDDYFYSVTQDADLTVKSNVGCLIVIRGHFKNVNDSPGGTSASNIADLEGLVDTIFRAELKVVPLKGAKYFQLKPVYLKVEKFEDRSWFSSSVRDYSVAINLTALGESVPFASTIINFKSVGLRDGIKEGIKEGDWRLFGVQSSPLAFPAEMADVNKAKEKREKEIAPYLLVYSVLVPSPESDLPTRPSLYADSDVDHAVKKYCAEVQSLNTKVPKKFGINDERCGFMVEAARQEFEHKLEKAERNDSNQKWASSFCTPDLTKEHCKEFKLDKKLEGRGFGFFNTSATITEVSKGSKFAAYLGEALKASETELSTAIQDKVISSKVKANKLAKEEAKRTGRQDVVFSDLDVDEAEAELADVMQDEKSSLHDLAAARVKLIKAKIASNNSRRSAGLPLLYSYLEE